MSDYFSDNYTSPDLTEEQLDFVKSPTESYSANDGNAGESAAQTAWQMMQDGASVIGESVSAVIAGLTNGYQVDYSKGTNEGTAPKAEESSLIPPAFKNFFTNEKNMPELIKGGFAFVVGMANSQAAKEAAALRAKADSDALIQKDKLQQDANKRFSDSITGMKPAQPWKPTPLKRLSGDNVFKPNGLINTGV